MQFPLDQAPADYTELVEEMGAKVWGLAPADKTTFFLGPRDALVMLGCSPPPLKYFHFRTFTGIRMQPLSMPSATLGDTVNNANINTTGGVNGAAPYNRTFLLVATADDGAYERVARAFVGAGLPASALNRDVIPAGPWVRFLRDGAGAAGEATWAADGADSLLLFSRLSLFADPDNAWLGAGSSAQLFHATPALAAASPLRTTTASPHRVARAKGTGRTERFLRAPLARLRAALVDHMADAFGAAEVARTLLSRDVRDDLRCIVDANYGVFYGGNPSGASGFCDNQAWDGLYMDSFGHALLAPDEAGRYHFDARDRGGAGGAEESSGPRRWFVAIGVNHGEVKNVGFNSLMISAHGDGFEDPDHSRVWNNDGSGAGGAALAGTARALGAGFERLFAVGISRDCAGAAFTCADADEDRVAPGAEVLAVDRLYLETDTATGADVDELLETELIVFEA